MLVKIKFNIFLRCFLIATVLGILSCGENVVPKPRAYLRLDYPKAKYNKAEIALPFSFEKNNLATNLIIRPVEGTTSSYGVNLEYPTMKGTIYLTYKAVEGSEKNLVEFLRDAQNFTQKHTVKADGILEERYEDSDEKVYGMFYKVGGNAASQSQFYVTDSINHFLTGSLYFNTKPNYDSILPAAHYLQKDIKHIMETVKWE
ncbi:gliding motility lipoprotein GldD [Aestuariivivens sp. NBU2969]|uniref:gliding motility lipoprotein GldD n=1 Tax=Aestuariivivens sp. NBU2969 TaxID=2873267 RepID=UPI001CC11956|nr:gliding motility lipoprotein GldD [Aestuariivivens sp. NBU2969]